MSISWTYFALAIPLSVRAVTSSSANSKIHIIKANVGDQGCQKGQLLLVVLKPGLIPTIPLPSIGRLSSGLVQLVVQPQG